MRAVTGPTAGRVPRGRETAVSRKVVRLTLDHLEALDATCRSCVFWELDPVRGDRVVDADEAREEKEFWHSRVLREWGSCGRVVLVDGEPAGYVAYAPASSVPGAVRFPTAPVSSDAVLMTALHVLPGHRGGGLGRMLVQGMARDLVGRGGIRAVEAFGRLGGPGIAGCATPADFLTSVGFKTHRAHPVYPRLRMDLRSAITWREEIEQAVDRLVGVIRPLATPEPAGRASRDTTTARHPAG